MKESLIIIDTGEKITYNVRNGGDFMLIRFKVANFLSFEKEQEFSMVAGGVKNKESHVIEDGNLKLLKFSSLYGANASGKSNLIKSVFYSQKIILEGLSFNMSNMYCRKKEANREKNSMFEYEIKIDNHYYAYGFEMKLATNSIQAEWLIELDKEHNKEVLIFSRKLDEALDLNAKYFNFEDEIINRLNLYYTDMKSQDNVLFLSIMNTNKDTLYEDNNGNIQVFRKVYHWFLNTLVVLFPSGTLISPYFNTEQTLEKINEIITKFGTGIQKCRVVPSSLEELQKEWDPNSLTKWLNMGVERYLNRKKDEVIKGVARMENELFLLEIVNENEVKVEKMILEHRRDAGTYSFQEESDGTKRLFDLLEILISSSLEKVYFLDELDRCLHPMLTYEFVKRFLNKTDNKTQLIVTTHESRLLNFNLLRRDEIWFLDREESDTTTLYSLEEFNERFDKKIDKAYLDGRYGGIPLFESVFPVGEEDENSK